MEWEVGGWCVWLEREREGGRRREGEGKEKEIRRGGGGWLLWGKLEGRVVRRIRGIEEVLGKAGIKEDVAVWSK